MLKKELCTPGSKIRTRSVLKDGLPANMGGGDQIEKLNAYPRPGGAWVDTQVFTIGPDEELTVLQGPKKKYGINMIHVQKGEQTGHVFWCELRVSSDHI